jgi:hypothetical protein
MNPEADHERLFADALTESAPAGFREAMLNQTLRLARRRRRFRQARRGTVVLIAFCALATLIWEMSPHPPSAIGLPPAGYELVRTRPFPAGRIVSTQPLAGDHRVASVAMANIVHTSDGIQEISDDQLLALMVSKPVALIRLGPNSERLVFVNPEDEKGFPIN